MKRMIPLIFFTVTFNAEACTVYPVSLAWFRGLDQVWTAELYTYILFYVVLLALCLRLIAGLSIFQSAFCALAAIVTSLFPGLLLAGTHLEFQVSSLAVLLCLYFIAKTRVILKRPVFSRSSAGLIPPFLLILLLSSVLASRGFHAVQFALILQLGFSGLVSYLLVDNVLWNLNNKIESLDLKKANLGYHILLFATLLFFGL